MTKPMLTPVSAVQPSTGFQSRQAAHRVSTGAKLTSSLDIREGQSVVLGKSNFDNTEDALFVIVQVQSVD